MVERARGGRLLPRRQPSAAWGNTSCTRAYVHVCLCARVCVCVCVCVCLCVCVCVCAVVVYVAGSCGIGCGRPRASPHNDPPVHQAPASCADGKQNFREGGGASTPRNASTKRFSGPREVLKFGTEIDTYSVATVAATSISGPSQSLASSAPPPRPLSPPLSLPQSSLCLYVLLISISLTPSGL